MKTHFLKIALGAVVVMGGLSLPVEAQRGRSYYDDGYYYGKPVNRQPRFRRKASRVDPRATVEIQVQQALTQRGYYRGLIDGDVGPKTRAAIRTYQVDKGLPVTGQIDRPLLKSLRLM